MKFLKVLATLIILLFFLLAGYYVYQDNESLILDVPARKALGGSFIKTSNGVVHYQLTGPDDAEIVVLVHGFSVPAFIWEPTFVFLKEQGYQVLRFDLFGRGFSDRPDKEYGLELFSQQLKDLLDQLEIEQPINLIGLSMGGPIVSRFTHQNPHRVKRLILEDPLVHQIPPTLIAPMEKPIIGEYLATVLMIPNMITSNHSEQNNNHVAGWGESFQQQSEYKGFRRAVLSSLRYFSSHNIVKEYKLLAKTPMPKLLIWGTADPTVPFTESETLLALMPQIKFVPIEDAGHVPMVEKPKIFNSILLDFLQNN